MGTLSTQQICRDIKILPWGGPDRAGNIGWYQFNIGWDVSSSKKNGYEN